MQMLSNLFDDDRCIGLRRFRFACEALIPASPFPALHPVRIFLAVRVDLRPPQLFEFTFPVGEVEKPLLGQELEGSFAEPLAEAALFGGRLVAAGGFDCNFVDGGDPLRDDEFGMGLRELAHVNGLAALSAEILVETDLPSELPVASKSVQLRP